MYIHFKLNDFCTKSLTKKISFQLVDSDVMFGLLNFYLALKRREKIIKKCMQQK